MKTSILKDAKWHGGSLYISKVFTFPCSIITANLLGPLLLGTWRALGLVQSYAAFLHMGIYDGITREIPYLKGRGEAERVAAYREAAFTTSLLISLGGAAALVIASLVLFRTGQDPLIATGVWVIALAFFFANIHNFYDVLLMADQEFVLASRVRIIYSMAGSLLQVAGVLFYGMNGLFASVVVSQAAIVAYLYREIPIRVRVPDRAILAQLLRTGVPMFLSGILNTMLYTTDRLSTVALLGRKELGLYAAAIMFATLIDFLPATIHRVLMPRILKQAGSSDSRQDLRKFWLEPLCLMAYFMPAVIGLVWILAPVGLYLFLPAYLEAVTPLRILIFSVYFAFIPGLTRNFFIAMNRQSRMLAIYLVVIPFCYALNYLLVRWGFGIAGVAAATALSFLLLGILYIIMALSLEKKRRETPAVLLRLYGPTILVLAILVSIETWMPSHPPTILRSVIDAGIRSTVYLTLVLSILTYLLKRDTMSLTSLAQLKRRASQTE